MEKIEKEMMEAAKELDFERATELRDILFEMKMEQKKKKIIFTLFPFILELYSYLKL